MTVLTTGVASVATQAAPPSGVHSLLFVFPDPVSVSAWVPRRCAAGEALEALAADLQRSLPWLVAGGAPALSGKLVCTAFPRVHRVVAVPDGGGMTGVRPLLTAPAPGASASGLKQRERAATALMWTAPVEHAGAGTPAAGPGAGGPWCCSRIVQCVSPPARVQPYARFVALLRAYLRCTLMQMTSLNVFCCLLGGIRGVFFLGGSALLYFAATGSSRAADSAAANDDDDGVDWAAGMSVEPEPAPEHTSGASPGPAHGGASTAPQTPSGACLCMLACRGLFVRY